MPETGGLAWGRLNPACFGRIGSLCGCSLTVEVERSHTDWERLVGGGGSLWAISGPPAGYRAGPCRVVVCVSWASAGGRAWISEA